MTDPSSSSLAPSRSTVYLANIPFSLTGNDLHKIVDKFGRVVKVTVVKDRVTRRSKGVAFILFLAEEDANRCVDQLNDTQLFGRQVKCSIATDNGRAVEFIRKRTYPDKSRCYECGEIGSHLSYTCPKNVLGERPPPKKSKSRKKTTNKKKLKGSSTPSSLNPSEHAEKSMVDVDDSDSESEEDEEEEETLSSAIRCQQTKEEEEEYRRKVVIGDYSAISPSTSSVQNLKRIQFKQNDYFSDEEDVVLST